MIAGATARYLVFVNAEIAERAPGSGRDTTSKAPRSSASRRAWSPISASTRPPRRPTTGKASGA